MEKNRKKQKIATIWVDGWRVLQANCGDEITTFDVAGEMANITWYRQGNFDINGKYVIAVEYFNEEDDGED